MANYTQIGRHTLNKVKMKRARESARARSRLPLQCCNLQQNILICYIYTMCFTMKAASRNKNQTKIMLKRNKRNEEGRECVREKLRTRMINIDDNDKKTHTLNKCIYLDCNNVAKVQQKDRTNPERRKAQEGVVQRVIEHSFRIFVNNHSK